MLKIPQMGKVKVVNRVDMLSFAITSEEEDTEKVDADSHSDSGSEDELVKLEVRPTREFPSQPRWLSGLRRSRVHSL